MQRLPVSVTPIAFVLLANWGGWRDIEKSDHHHTYAYIFVYRYSNKNTFKTESNSKALDLLDLTFSLITDPYSLPLYSSRRICLRKCW